MLYYIYQENKITWYVQAPMDVVQDVPVQACMSYWRNQIGVCNMFPK